MIALFDTLTLVNGTLHKITIYASVYLAPTIACNFNAVFSRLAMSILSTTYLAIQICVVCIFPFVGPRICGLKTIAIVTAAFGVFILVNILPDFLLYERYGNISQSAENKSTLYCYTKAKDNNATRILKRFEAHIRLWTLHLLPAIITSFCMVPCLITLNKRKMIKSQMRTQQAKKTTITLVLIMLSFVLGELPTSVSMVYWVFHPPL